MPVAHVWVRQSAVRTAVQSVLPIGFHKLDDPIGLFGKVVQQVASAALHALPNGELRPEHIIVLFHEIGSHDRIEEDVHLDIEAMYYPERAIDADERNEQIIAALKVLFPLLGISGWVKVVTASWRSTIIDAPLEPFDMSMAAAISRSFDLLETAGN